MKIYAAPGFIVEECETERERKFFVFQWTAIIFVRHWLEMRK